MGADTGNGSELSGVLTPGLAYSVVTAPFGSRGSAGDRYYLYVYTGTTIGNSSFTTGSVSTSSTSEGRPPLTTFTSFTSQSCEGTTT